jgi:hypothetical protein
MGIRRTAVRAEPLNGSRRRQEALTDLAKQMEPPDVGCYEIETLNVEPETLNPRLARMSLLSYHSGLAALGRFARSDFHCRDGIKSPSGCQVKSRKN